jgi:hypothetical protein
MKVRLVRPIAFRKVGTELDVPDGVGELWLLQKKVERVVDQPEQSAVQCMVPQCRPDTATRPRKKMMVA